MAVSALSAAAQSPAAKEDKGWTTTVYPIYAWIPVFGADITLPNVPIPPGRTDCGGSGATVTPSGSVHSKINGAAFAAVMVENTWVQIQANFLFAGLSASKASPNL